MACSRQTTKKYTSRDSPPYPANQCCSQTKKGNDGLMYVSKRNSSGVCTWSLKKRSKLNSRKSSRKSSRKTSSRKHSSRRTTSRKSSSKYTRPRKIVGTRDQSKDKPMSKMTRDELIKEIRQFASKWTRKTKRHQDMDMVRLKTEPVSELKKFLKHYREHTFKDFGW